MTTTDKAASTGEREPKLSLCMIVKNEAHFLARCLGAVKDHVDEIIVVDTGSTDQTRAIAAEFTDKVYDFEWCDDFARARNYSLEQATGDWILVLDADEWIEESSVLSLRQLIRETQDDAFFLVQYHYSDNPLEKNWVPVKTKSPYSMGYRGYRETRIARLFRNREDIRYHGRIHEVIDPSLEQLNFSILEIPLHHHIDGDPTKPKRDRQLNYLRIMEEVLENRPDGRLCTIAASACMYHKQDYRKAIEYFQQAVDLDFDRNENLEGIAEAHYRLGELRQAYDIYIKLLESGYVTFVLCNNLANLMVKSEQYSRAVELLNLSMSLAEVDEETEARLKHNIKYLEKKAGASPGK